MRKGLKIFLLLLLIAIIAGAIIIPVLIKNSNKIVKQKLESYLGKDFSVKELKLKWNEVEAIDVNYKNPEGQTVFSADSMKMKADLMSILKKEYNVSDLTLVNPYIKLETDEKGNLKLPFHSRKSKEEKNDSPPLLIQKIHIINGSIDYLDEKVDGEPVLTQLRNIELESENLLFPIQDNFSSYHFSAKITGKLNAGVIKSEGNINLKTLDMDSKVSAQNLDITPFKPYYQKKNSVNIKKGNIDIKMDLKINSGNLYAPGNIVLKNLELEKGKGISGFFLSLPADAVVSFLKDNKGRISFDFMLEGNLSDPEFNIRESFVDKIAYGMAQKLGVPIADIGESIIIAGTKGVKQIGKKAENISSGIKKIIK
jgi:uncharacterized protein YhdP